MNIKQALKIFEKDDAEGPCSRSDAKTPTFEQAVDVLITHQILEEKENNSLWYVNYKDFLGRDMAGKFAGYRTPQKWR